LNELALTIQKLKQDKDRPPYNDEEEEPPKRTEEGDKMEETPKSNQCLD